MAIIIYSGSTCYNPQNIIISPEFDGWWCGRLVKICLLVPAQPSPGPGPERRAADTVIERPETDDIVRSL